MIITHVFTGMNYVYTTALIEMFINKVNNVNHRFLICDLKVNAPDRIDDFSKDADIIYSNSLSRIVQAKQMIACLESSDYVIFHFLPNNIFLHFELYFKKELYSKMIWRIWGADLYNWKKNGIQGIAFNGIREYTRKRIKSIIAEPMDRPEFIKQFGSSVSFIDGPDPKGYNIDTLEKNKEEKTDNIIYILVGHSAVIALNHIKILNDLKHYKNENIKIILPLNYGDSSYAKEVYNEAVKIFTTEKIIAINEKLDMDKYIKLLWHCDIAIIHSDRQIAMGNITMLMYMLKKIYLKKESIMDRYYRSEQGLEIYDSNTISNLTFDEFKESKHLLINREYATKEINIDDIASTWKESFEKIKEASTWV